MHNSRPHGVVSLRQSSVKQESFYQRIAVVARSRMDHQPCGFIHDDDLGIFVQNRKIKACRLEEGSETGFP
jgi:hypothetical protein